MEENQHNYHDQYYGDNDYEPEDEGEVVEGYGDGEYLDTEFDPEHGKYYYMEDVSLPMPLHTLMSKGGQREHYPGHREVWHGEAG